MLRWVHISIYMGPTLVQNDEHLTTAITPHNLHLATRTPHPPLATHALQVVAEGKEGGVEGEKSIGERRDGRQEVNG